MLERGRAMLREQMRLLGDPRRGLDQFGQRVDDLLHRLTLDLQHHLRRERARLSTVSAGLDHLNPLSILSRGTA